MRPSGVGESRGGEYDGEGQREDVEKAREVADGATGAQVDEGCKMAGDKWPSSCLRLTLQSLVHSKMHTRKAAKMRTRNASMRWASVRSSI
mgnify:CR=1 FL=1